MSKRCYVAIIISLCAMICLAQNESASLADAARKAREGKTKSKVVITDDTLNSQRGPLADMNIEGVDNSDEIIKAVGEYRKNHTPAETEVAVHDWYNRYDTIFQHAFEDNEQLKSRAQDRRTTPRQYSDDWRKYNEQRMTEAHTEVQESRDYQKNGLLMARIQNTFQKIRNALGPMGLKYEWMKIRFGNGNGSW